MGDEDVYITGMGRAQATGEWRKRDRNMKGTKE
jgi:hypothetical protein